MITTGRPMNNKLRRRTLLTPLILLPSMALSQVDPDQRAAPDTRLPNGKSQQEEILKADYEKTLKDCSELIELAEQLKAELEKNDRHVLSISSLKKTEDIEKLAKRIRSRLRRF